MHRPSQPLFISVFHSISLVSSLLSLLFFLPPSFISPAVSLFVSLLPWFLSILILFSGCLFILVHFSICPSFVSCSLLLRFTLPLCSYPTSLFPLPSYLSISQLNSRFKDCFSHLRREGGGKFTGAWMSFSAGWLWSKALSTVKADPSLIHNLLQSLENTQRIFSLISISQTHQGLFCASVIMSILNF